MEKEIIITRESLNLCFLYEEFDLSDAELLEFKQSFEYSLPALSEFLKNELKIIKPVNINLSLVGDETIKRINKEHREKDKVTDVLSFPLQDNIRKGDYDKLFPHLELGDLFICHSVCEAQAIEFKISYQDEFIHLMTHGFLHLLGYDHEISEEEEMLMESLENKIISHISANKSS